MRSAAVILLLALSGHGFGSPAWAQVHSVGHSTQTHVLSHAGEDCAGLLIHSHDGSFENAYAWSGAGVQPPYYGAFAESYDLGPVNVVCAAFWLTQIGNFVAETADLYIWSGGVTAEPGNVLWMLPEYLLESPAVWPDLSQQNVEIDYSIDGAFTIGLRPNHGLTAVVFVGVDLNTGGRPWTCVAPGIGYPEGWQHPGIVWQAPQLSVGSGVYVTGFSPIESSTWGAVKALFD